MPEVLRAATRRFPSFEAKSEKAKIIWTVQGWAAPENFYMKGDNLKEFAGVAEAVRITPTILEVQGLMPYNTTMANLKRITDLVEQQGEKLTNCEFILLASFSDKEAFFGLQGMSLKWKVKQVEVFMGIHGTCLNVADLAASPLHNGHIGRLLVNTKRNEVNFEDLKKV